MWHSGTGEGGGGGGRGERKKDLINTHKSMTAMNSFNKKFSSGET